MTPSLAGDGRTAQPGGGTKARLCIFDGHLLGSTEGCAVCAGGSAGGCAEHWAHAEQAVAELAVPGVCVCACVCVCVCACVVVRA